MKKFLSSLLALTMILSLVIVPANAAVGDDTIKGVSVSESTVTLNKFNETQNVTFTAPKNLKAGDTVNVNGKDVVYSSNFKSSIASANNNVAMCSQGGDTVTIIAVGYGETTISYTVSLDYQDNETYGTATQTLTTKVTVAAPEVTYTITARPLSRQRLAARRFLMSSMIPRLTSPLTGTLPLRARPAMPMK